MNTQQSKDIDRIQALVRSAGQNILDALAEIKSIKEDPQMQTQMPENAPGRITRVIRGPHGMVVMGNIDPKTEPRWKARENRDGSTTYVSADAPELPDRRRDKKTRPTQPNGRTERPRRHEPYKRDRSGRRSW